jgi:hypothetical protein
MSLHKKILLFLIVALVLIVVLLGGIFAIFKRAANAPATDFRGPDSAPYATGPSGPPPSSY